MSEAKMSLADRLSTAERGTGDLSRDVFLALGGELREEPVSKQSSDARVLPFWRGAADPCIGISFTTSLNDLAHELEARGIEWGCYDKPGRACLGTVEGKDAIAATPALAVCAALARHLEGEA